MECIWHSSEFLFSQSKQNKELSFLPLSFALIYLSVSSAEKPISRSVIIMLRFSISSSLYSWGPAVFSYLPQGKRCSYSFIISGGILYFSLISYCGSSHNQLPFPWQKKRHTDLAADIFLPLSRYTLILTLFIYHVKYLYCIIRHT